MANAPSLRIEIIGSVAEVLDEAQRLSLITDQNEPSGRRLRKEDCFTSQITYRRLLGNFYMREGFYSQHQAQSQGGVWEIILALYFCQRYPRSKDGDLQRL